MSGRRALAVLVVVGLLAWGHWIYWYAPAERSGRPMADSFAGRLFLGAELPYRLWVPYPHQNLAHFERSIGRLDDVLDEVARLEGDGHFPRLPAFGGLRLPPATELTVSTDESGDRLIVAASVYPLVGLLSRWAGRLAGNPLLSGGRVELDGRVFVVRWREGCWLLASREVDLGASEAGAAAGRGESPGEDSGQALAWVRLARPRGDLAPGDYRLERRGRDLEFSGGEPSRLERLAELADRRAPLPLVRLEGTTDAAVRRWRALALVPGLDSLGGLPGAVAVDVGAEPFSLPGERIAAAIGDGVLVREEGGWEIRALDRGSLERGEAVGRFARQVAPHLPLETAMWLDLRPAERLTEQVAAALEAVPIVGRREARRWRAALALLRRLHGFERLTILVGSAPSAVRVRLWNAGGEN